MPGLYGILKPYRGMLVLLILIVLAANSLNLWLPKIISRAIDMYIRQSGSFQTILLEFGLATLAIFVFTYLQSIIQTFISERVARDVRHDLSGTIASHSYLFIQKITPAKLLTNLTSDVDSIKMFVAQAIANIVSSAFIIIGASVLLLSINWRLGLGVLAIVPIIGGTFFLVLSKVRALFLKTREIIDWLNKVINESIIGALLIRVLNSQRVEEQKFLAANARARDIGLQILGLFSAMIPIITFTANLAILVILVLGGHFVIGGVMTLGDFAAFNSYVAILIFPILVLGFMSNVIAQAQASYGRVAQVFYAPVAAKTGTRTDALTGEVAVKDITLIHGDKTALKNVSLDIRAGTKTAIIGPTAAGKTQLLYLLIGLIEPASGTIEYDGRNIHEYDEEALHRQIGFVFQDSIIFNMTLRENIAFNGAVSDEDLEKAIKTAELWDFVHTLPEKLESVVSERGASLSGGQKQRVMLARALALNPKILLLDDFTARVDTTTERKILDNIARNYPGITLVSITQKIASVEQYDQIALLMEGELIAVGTHAQLLETSPEYAQIHASQQSTHHYELHA
ncbi:MAG TPA: ABC transporter ATP-binding protein [Candidatus Paceibacterota bacterium]|nr:ABC transporter ATP-binding protein [Candidatus Paceibacterota bacterium]